SWYYRTAAHRRAHPFPTRRSSDLPQPAEQIVGAHKGADGLGEGFQDLIAGGVAVTVVQLLEVVDVQHQQGIALGRRRGAAQVLVDRKSTRLNSSHVKISYAVFCLK